MRAGNAQCIFFWYDKWAAEVPLKDKSHGIYKWVKVKDCYQSQEGITQWSLHLRRGSKREEYMLLLQVLNGMLFLNQRKLFLMV